MESFTSVLNLALMLAWMCLSTCFVGVRGASYCNTGSGAIYCKSGCCPDGYGWYECCDTSTSSLSGGAVAGIVIGIILFVVFAVLIIYLCNRYSKGGHTSSKKVTPVGSTTVHHPPPATVTHVPPQPQPLPAYPPPQPPTYPPPQYSNAAYPPPPPPNPYAAASGGY